MKKIEMFLPVNFNTEVLESTLEPAGIHSISFIEMRVFNTGPAKTEKYRGVERQIRYSSKLKAEILVADHTLSEVSDILKNLVSTRNKEEYRAYISEII